MKIENAQALGASLRQRRLKEGLSVLQLAERIGLAPMTIIRLEKGVSGYVHQTTASKMASNGLHLTFKAPIMAQAVQSTNDTKQALLALRKQLDRLLIPLGVERRSGKDRRVILAAA